MMNSKAIRGDYLETKEPKTKIVKAFVFLYDQLDHYVLREIRAVYRKTSRSLAFARIGWGSYDFDRSYLFELMVFKMERMHHCMEHGHVIQDVEIMASLKEAIEICKRAEKSSYEDVYFEQHDQKWGELKMDFEPIEKKDGNPHRGSRALFSRPNAVTKKQKEQELKESRAIWEKAAKDRKKDMLRLGQIFDEYSEGWWE